MKEKGILLVEGDHMMSMPAVAFLPATASRELGIYRFNVCLFEKEGDFMQYPHVESIKEVKADYVTYCAEVISVLEQLRM